MLALALCLPATTLVVATAPHLAYGGGPVLFAPKVYMTYWGWGVVPNADPDGAEAYLTGFWQGVGGSDWAAIQTQYTGPGGAHIGNPTDQYGGSWHDDSLTVLPVNNVAVDGASKEALQAEAHFGYDPNGIYFVALPHGDDSDFAGGYCAYHGAVADAQGRMIAYAMLPYVSDFPTVNDSVTTADCGVGIIANSPHPRLDAFSTVAGHEYAEAVTDPQPSSGWYDKNNGENADICAFVFTGPGAHAEIHLSTGDYGVQSLWSNEANSCVTSVDQPTLPPPPPPPSVQTAPYVGPAGEVDCFSSTYCMTFDVPPGSSHVQLQMVDDVSPHTVGYYCVGSCAGAKGYFCDGTTLAVPPGAEHVIVIVNNYGLGTTTCNGNLPVDVEGSVTATFS